MLIDCRKFSYDLNNSLGVCRGFSDYVKTEDGDTDEEEDSEKVEDVFLKLNLFTPNPTRII